MLNFFEDIRDQLEKRPEPDFEPEYWIQMAQKLNVHQPKLYFHSPFKFLIFGAVGIFLLLFLGIFISHFHQAKQLVQISNQITSLKMEADSLSHMGIFMDTVEKEMLLKKILPPKPPLPLEKKTLTSKRENKTNSGLKQNEYSPLSNQPLVDKVETSKTRLTYKSNNDRRNPDAKQTISFASSISPLSKIIIRLPKQLEIQPHQLMQEKISAFPISLKKHQPLRIRLKGVETGVNIGGLMLIYDSLSETSGLTIGLETGVRLTNKLRIWGQLSLMNMQYGTKREIPSLGIPLWKSPSPTHTLSKVEVKRTGLFFSGGIDFTQALLPKIEGFIGLGYGGGTWLPYGVRYEFDDDDTEDYEGESENIIVDKTPFKGSLWQARSGFNYKLKNRLECTLMANYRFQSPQTTSSFPGMLDIRAGLVYKFSN